MKTNEWEPEEVETVEKVTRHHLKKEFTANKNVLSLAERQPSFFCPKNISIKIFHVLFVLATFY